RLRRLEQVQDVFRTRCGPQGEQLMVGVCERPPAADGDEARVAVFREDHGCTLLLASAQRPGFSRRLGVRHRPVGPPPAITTACLVIATLLPASPAPAHHIPRPPRRPCRTARRSTRPRAVVRPPRTGTWTRASAGAPAGRPAPAARRHRPAAPRPPRTAARTPAAPRRVRATAPRVPPPVRRARVTHTSTPTHPCRSSHFRRFWPLPAILRHDPGPA